MADSKKSNAQKQDVAAGAATHTIVVKLGTSVLCRVAH